MMSVFFSQITQIVCAQKVVDIKTHPCVAEE